MIIERLEARNAVTYRYLDLTFPASGLIGIEGQNLDKPTMGSNGVGKSVFEDLITYGIHGEIARKRRANIVGQFGRKLDLNIYMRMEDGTPFIIKRQRDKLGGEKVQLEIGGSKWKGNITKVQPIITRAFGMGWLTFKNCVIFSDDAGADHFLKATDIKQKEILAEISDILHFGIAKKLISKEIKTIRQQLAYFEGELRPLREQREQCKTRLSEYKGRLGNHNEEVKAKREKFETQIEKLMRQLANSNISKSITGVDKEIQRFNKKRNNLYSSIESESYQAMLEEWIWDAEKKEAKKLTLIEKYQKDQRYIDKHGKCPTCKKEHKGNLKNLDKELESLAKLQAELIKEKQALQKEFIDPELEIIVLDKTIEELNLMKKEFKSQLQEEETLRATVENLKLKLRNIDNIKEAIENNITHYAKELDAADAEYSRVYFKLKSIDNTLKSHEFWLGKYGQRGLPADFIADLLTELQMLADEYSQDLTDGSILVDIHPYKETKEGQQKNEIKIDIIENGVPKDFKLYSGGEKNRVEKAFSLALMKLTKSFIGFKLFDEIGKNLSREGYEKVVMLMKDVFQGQQIFLATNDPIVRKLFDYRMLVTLENNRSTIKTSWR